MGENRKKVNAVLRKVAQNIERANKLAERVKLRSVSCTSCKTRTEVWWNYCAMCGWHIAAEDPPSYSDPPFGCPPDEEAK
jgi:hypothetical protein